jgi:hypothetical protein
MMDYAIISDDKTKQRKTVIAIKDSSVEIPWVPDSWHTKKADRQPVS